MVEYCSAVGKMGSYGSHFKYKAFYSCCFQGVPYWLSFLVRNPNGALMSNLNRRTTLSSSSSPTNADNITVGSCVELANGGKGTIKFMVI